MTSRAFVLIAAALSGAVLSAEQAPRHYVNLLVSVAESGRANLAVTDFKVLEDGREVPVISVGRGPAPVSVAVVLDSSDRLQGLPQQRARQAVERLYAKLTAEDEIVVLFYDQGVTIPREWTPGGGALAMPWDRWKTARFSELLQGVYQAIFVAERAKNVRAAVVGISDAEQVGSRHPLRAFLKSRRQAEVAIFGLRTQDLLDASSRLAGPKPHGPDGTTTWDSRGAVTTFDDLVRGSGGRTLAVRTEDEIERNVDALLNELRHQYVITFQSQRPFDDTFRRVKVDVPGRGVTVRHREEVLASRQ